jgi:hypothetical protein
MSKQIFKSNRHFTIFDFSISHGQLLLRASKDDNNIKNIDIVFFGVRYIQLFTSFLGLSIRSVKGREDLIHYDSVNFYLKYDKNHLFEIETVGEKFYIAASFFKVYENELEFNETSLGMHEPMGRDNEVAG